MAGIANSLLAALPRKSYLRQRQKLIEYSRGNIRILDDRGLEKAACACYKTVKDMRNKKGRRRPST